MKTLTLLLFTTILVSCNKDHSDDPKPMPVPPIVQPNTTHVDTTQYFLKYEVPANIEVLTVFNGDSVIDESKGSSYTSYATIEKGLTITFKASGPINYYVMERNLDNADLGKIYTTQKNVTSGTIDLSQLP